MSKLLVISRAIIIRFWTCVSRKPSSPPKVFLVVQLAKLGDMVCTTPVFHAIKHKYPNAKVIVVGNAVNEEVLKGNTDVDEYIVFDKRRIGEVAAQLKQRNIDFACITAPDFSGLAFLLLAGVRTIVAPRVVEGNCPTQTYSYRILRALVQSVPHRMGHYAPREYLRLLGPAGVESDDTTKHLHFSPEAHHATAQWLVEQGVQQGAFVVGIAPAAGNRIKMWPIERFVAVADYLRERYGSVVVMIEKMKSIDELKAVVSQLHMLIAVDTGPIYIAEAFGIPTIDITGPIDEREQPPISDRNLVITPVSRKRPQLFVMDAHSYNFAEARRQAESITVGMVTDAADRLMERLKK